MSIKVALNHQTTYHFDRPVRLGPHILRLRPAPHCPVPIENYSLRVHHPENSLLWLQDPYGNFLARVTFPDVSNELKIEVNLIAEIQTVNPFAFFLEPYAEKYPFTYEPALAKELTSFLEITESGPLLKEWLAKVDKRNIYITDFLCWLNTCVQQEIIYSPRFESGIHTCEETLEKKIASCRDTTWLLVQMLRHFGLGARFVSGYLIQLVPEEKTLNSLGEYDGPKEDSADLHAWAEVYLPGAGWIGLDPTSGLMTAEGHIPLACTASPERAAPVTGSTEFCRSNLDFAFKITRLQSQIQHIAGL